MRAVSQYEWTDNEWCPVAVYLFTPEMMIGQACTGRPDIAAWVESVRAGATWSPGQNLEELATQMCEQFSHQEYGSLYEEVEPAPTLEALAAREFAGVKAIPPVTPEPSTPADPAGIAWTPGYFDDQHQTGDWLDGAREPDHGAVGRFSSTPADDDVALPVCRACGSSRVAAYLYGEPRADPGLMARLRSGQVVLGGCIIDEDQPDYRCNECGREFRADDRPGGGGAALNSGPI